jgi:hypothetical protein
VIKHRITALLGATILAACSSDGSTSGSVTVSDSAGIRIVTHSAPASVDTIASAPVLTIGREGDPNYEFFRLATVLGLSDGTIVAANGGAEVRFYDPSGAHLRTVGGRGDGPEEFGSIGGLWLRPNDSIAVVDARRRRLVVLDREGGFHGERSLAASLGTPARITGQNVCSEPTGIVGLLGDGREVVRGWACTMGAVGGPPSPMLFPLWIANEDGADSVGVFRANEAWAPTGGDEHQIGLVPFSTQARPVAGGDRVYAASGGGYQIEVFGPEGGLTAILRENAPARPLSTAEIAQYRSDEEAAGRPVPAEMPIPGELPAYHTLLVSEEGELWARHSPLTDDTHQTWSVFSADGTRLRRVVLPDFTLTSIRGDRLYGIVTDGAGVQKPVVFVLVG